MKAATKSPRAHMALGDMLRATMFGTLAAVVNDVLHLPLHVPGHTSIWWMGILIVGKGTVKEFGSGLVMGTISGILAVVMGLGNEGFLVFLTYFIPGLVLDLLTWAFGQKLHSVVIGGIIGAVISVSKLAASLVVGVLAHAPMLFLTIGLGYTAIFHAIFGLIGGILAAVILKRLGPRLQAAPF